MCDPLSQPTLSLLMLTPDDESESGSRESDSDEEGEKKVRARNSKTGLVTNVFYMHFCTRNPSLNLF